MENGVAPTSTWAFRRDRDLKAALESARLLYQAGRFDEAEDGCREILRNYGNWSPAFFLMGLAALRSGDPERALELLGKAVSARRAQPSSRFALGQTARALGRLEVAGEAFRTALRLKPDYAEAMQGLAMVLLAQGRSKEAATWSRRSFACAAARRLGPLFDLPIRLWDFVAAGLDREPGGRQEWLARAHARVAARLERRRKLEQARARYERALRCCPRSVDALLGLGDLLISLEQPSEALRRLEAAADIRPDDPRVNAALGEALVRTGWQDQGTAHIEAALGGGAEHGGSLMAKIGRALLAAGDVERAASMLQQSLSRWPKDADCHYALARALRRLGRRDEAAAHLDETLAIDDGHVGALEEFLNLRKPPPDDARMHRALRLAESGALPAKQRRRLHFAAGGALEAWRAYDEAFAHWVRGNELKDVEFDPAAHEEMIGKLIATFDADFFAERKDFGVRSPDPVFIVGMPRSGTTLVEQILASHPEVFGAGELTAVHSMTVALPDMASLDAPYPECTTGVDRAAARGLASGHLDRLKALSGGAARVTDKMPGNFCHLGLIALLFPEARIIHCRRNALDVCLSIFALDFEGDHPYAYDLANLGSYYRQYERLMAQWRRVLPLPILDVDYETLVRNQEAESRRIVDFCRLAWDERCLSFYETPRAVVTSSVDQVRRPIYTSSIDRWRNYEEHLGPLEQALGVEGSEGAGRRRPCLPGSGDRDAPDLGRRGDVGFGGVPRHAARQPCASGNRRELVPGTGWETGLNRREV